MREDPIPTEENTSSNKKFDQVKKLLNSAQNNIEKISTLIEKMEQDERREMYKKLPGVEGTFDGVCLVSDSGEKFEVPANYAAKSRLVFGDKLKILEENGKKVFKQIEKVERKKIDGVLSKKEGSWFILSDAGSYRISDVAAEFNRVEVHNEATAFIPADNVRAPFAALDKVVTKNGEPQKDIQPKPEKKIEKSEKAPVMKKEVTKKKDVENGKEIVLDRKPKKDEKKDEKAKVDTKKAFSSSGTSYKAPVKFEKPALKVEKEPKREVIPDNKDNKEFVQNILGEDDLR